MLVGWPPEDLADGAAGGKNYAIWLHFARKKYGKTAKFRTGLYARNRCINKIVVSVCKGIDRYARNMDMPSRFGDPSLSSYLYIIVRQVITLWLFSD